MSKYRWIIGLLVLFGGLLPLAAQNIVTDDQVNAIAEKLYCPVCENITLDTCGTAACADWRYEIRLQLEAGKTEPEIVDDFVRRFGDRVVGTPQDPLLRSVALLPIMVLVVIGLGLAGYTFIRLRRPSQTATLQEEPQDKYRAMLERDLGS